MGLSLAVIGAGPAGLYAAREAIRLGFDVKIYEKNAVGDAVHCAEGFFDMLKLLEPPSAGVCCKVSEIIFKVKDTFHIDASNLNIWMLDRREWQINLARELMSQGCTIYEHTPVTPALFDELVKTFDWLIDASGVLPISVKTGRAVPVRYAHAAQYTLHGDFSALIGRIKAVVMPDYCGYYWIFPKQRDLANVGVGFFVREPGGRMRIHDELKRILKKEGLEDCQVVKKSGGPIPVSVAEKVVYGKTLLVGDAAGLASPLHGGGIDSACVSGILAVRALAMNKPLLYEESLRKVLGTRLALEQQVLDAWQEIEFDDLNQLAAVAFGKGLARFGSMWKQRSRLLQEVAILRYFSRGRIRADWQSGVCLKDIETAAYGGE